MNPANDDDDVDSNFVDLPVHLLLLTVAVVALDGVDDDDAGRRAKDRDKFTYCGDNLNLILSLFSFLCCFFKSSRDIVFLG